MYKNMLDGTSHQHHNMHPQSVTNIGLVNVSSLVQLPLLSLSSTNSLNTPTASNASNHTIQNIQTSILDKNNKNYNLEMKCWVNGNLVSQGNMKDMDWTFAEIIERCSYGVTLYPGDVIGSGTVGAGCFLELNGTAKLNNPQHQPQWLQPNDSVTMEIDGLGTLHTIIRAEATDWSILQLKKNV